MFYQNGNLITLPLLNGFLLLLGRRENSLTQFIIQLREILRVKGGSLNHTRPTGMNRNFPEESGVWVTLQTNPLVTWPPAFFSMFFLFHHIPQLYQLHPHTHFYCFLDIFPIVRKFLHIRFPLPGKLSLCLNFSSIKWR